MRYRKVTRVPKSREDLIDEIVTRTLADMTPNQIRAELEDRLYDEFGRESDSVLDGAAVDLDIDLYHEPQEWED